MSTEPQTWDDGAQVRMQNILVRARHLSTTMRQPINVGTEIARTHDDLVSIVFAEDFNDARSQADLLEHWERFGALGLIGRRNLGLPDHIDDIVATVIGKQRDYGPQNIARFGNHGLVIRAFDKVARYENLCKIDKQALNEPIEDTLLDFIGYAIVAMLWNTSTENGSNWFLLPMRPW